MAKTLSKKDIKILKQLGFKRRFPDDSDPDYFEYRLNIPNHAYLKGLHVVVEEVISVYCKEDKSGFTGGSVLVLQKKYKLRRVLKLLKLLVLK